MSKIRELIIETMHKYHAEMGYLENTETLKKIVKFRKDSCDQLEESIKAEIMGLDTIISWSEVDYVKQSSLENLFKESE